MNTEIIKIHDAAFSHPDILKAAQIICDGGLVCFPTETVYGLGGNGIDPGAATKIYAAKGRPADNPLIIHIAHPEDAEKYAITNEYYYKLAQAFMPGPLTVILPKRNIVPDEVTGGLPNGCGALSLTSDSPRSDSGGWAPIAAPSANLSGKPSPTSARHVIEDMSGRVNLIIDGGDCEIGLESTIITLNGSEAVLLRPGAVTFDALMCVCEHIRISDAAAGLMTEIDKPLAPGMKYKHYAPATPLVLLEGSDKGFIDFIRKERVYKNCAVICSKSEGEILSGKNIILTGAADELNIQAKRLFSALREADALGCDIIYARKPAPHGLGLALYNRMIRAASHTVLKID